MKNFFTILLTAVISIPSVMAQVPQGISYQAIAFSANGTPVSNGSIGVKISVLNGSATGSVAYVETHTKSTNAQGLFNLNIGQGNPTSGNFWAINWGSGSKYLKVEIDPNGGTNYTVVGTNQLMSVPYALFAENVNGTNVINTIKSGSQTGKLIVIYTSSMAYGFYQTVQSGSGYWESQSLDGPVLGAIASDSNIVIYTATTSYGFYQTVQSGSGYWETQSLSGAPIGAISSGKNIVVYTSTTAYGFYRTVQSGSGYWESQSLSGTPIGASSSRENIVVYTSSTAYGFYQTVQSGSGYWESQSLSGTPVGATASSNNIVIYTNSTAYGFYQNVQSGSGYWESQPLSGTPSGIISR